MQQGIKNKIYGEIPLWLFLHVTAGFRGGGRPFISVHKPPQSANREAAAKQVDHDQPASQYISKMVEEVGVGHAVHRRVHRDCEEENRCDVF